MADPILFFVYALTFIISVFLLIYLVMSRNYEDSRFGRSISMFIFSIFIFTLTVVIKVVVGLRENFRILVLPVEAIPILSDIGLVALAPFFGICLLVSALLFKEDLK